MILIIEIPLSKFSFLLSSKETGDMTFPSSSNGGGDVAMEPSDPIKLISPVTEPGLAMSAAPAVLARRKAGGLSSAGNTSGSFSPDRAISHRCMHKTNSSQDKRPSTSMSDSPLHQIDSRNHPKITFY